MSEIKKVKIKNGTFYLSSKTDGGEGWTKQEFKSPSSGEEMVRYHKELSIEGNITYVGMKEDKFAGKVLSILINESRDVTYSLELPIMSTKGIKTTGDYFNSIIGSLVNVSKGDKVTLFVNNKNKDKNDRLYRNIVMLDSEGKLIKSNFQFSEVPRWNSKQVEDDFGEETTEYDASPTNKFYIDLAKQVVDNFGKGSTPSSNSAAQQLAASEKAMSEPVDVSSLPF